jgi:hypothetical protein
MWDEVPSSTIETKSNAEETVPKPKRRPVARVLAKAQKRDFINMDSSIQSDIT